MYLVKNDRNTNTNDITPDKFGKKFFQKMSPEPMSVLI